MSFESFGNPTGAGMFTHKEVTEDFSSPALAAFTDKHMQYAVYKAAHTFKLFLRVVLIVALVWLIWTVATYIADRVFGVKLAGMLKVKKEGHQYLGASTDIAVETTEVPDKTLQDKKFAALQEAETNMATTAATVAPKSPFTVERLGNKELDPEKKYMQGVVAAGK
jgi:hypothetical protein